MNFLRRSTLLVLSALALNVLGCSGDPASSFDDPALEALDEQIGGGGTGGGHHQMQTPPVKVMISALETRLIGMVATNQAIGGYPSQTELWHARPDVTIDGDLEMISSSLDGATERDVEDWLSPLDQAFSTPRIVKQTDWQRGIASFPSELNQYLFAMEHPDDENDVLGVLLVVEPVSGILGGPPSGKLVAAAWYRTSAPNTDGLAFQTRTFQKRMELVLDENGNPSTDPNDIREAGWHYVTMPTR